MNPKKVWSGIFALLFAVPIVLWTGPPAFAKESGQELKYKGKVTPQERKEAGARFKAKRMEVLEAFFLAGMGMTPMPPMPEPGGIPHYFGPYPNYANAPLPKGAIASVAVVAGGTGYVNPVVNFMDLFGTGLNASAVATTLGGVITGITVTAGGEGFSAPWVIITDPGGTGAGASATAAIGPPFTGGIRKFVDSLPGIGPLGANNLGQYLPVAVADTTSFPGSDYYEIEVGEYQMQMHSDLPPTTLRGYRQTNTSDPTVSVFSYLGPVIVTSRDRPVRVKFTNSLPTGTGGNLFIPVDTTIMGAGMGSYGMNPPVGDMYHTQNRATIHLHGNNTVWISDGTPHQWVTPANEVTAYPKGVSVVNVPDMPDPGPGSMTFYYTNQHSARLMFYHDHSFGITRLNVYAGEAAGYLVTDMVEMDLIQGTDNTGVNPGLVSVLPDLGVPLIIQDKTFVDPTTIGYQDPTWAWGMSAVGATMTPTAGSLWYPHVYMPNQNPYDLSGMNAFGRWHYGPWFWPPTNVTYGPIPNIYYDPVNAPWEPPMAPPIPNPSSPAEGFMDTPVINGTVYPYMVVEPRAYRFRILNAANDRFLNLQLYVADPLAATAYSLSVVNTEVAMVPSPDGRQGGIPDPTRSGPSFIQIGTEGGFLPAPVVLPNKAVQWNFDQTNFDFGNVNGGTLILGTAERADVIVDFSQYAGQTLILYNDAPAPFPAIDPRYDYYTGNPDQTDIGGAPSTLPGYGPNTRTLMQIQVLNTTPAPAYNLAALQTVFAKAAAKTGVFEVSQDPIIIPEARYGSAYGATNFPADPYARIFHFSSTFAPIGTTTRVTIPFQPKAIQDEMGEAFDVDYGRMSAMLGLEQPITAAGAQRFVLYPYASPPVEIVKGTVYGQQIGSQDDGTQIWRITHNGVDTHTIHTHLFNAQLINRVAWDNAIRPPDANELGWKETFRVNPLQDTIIAFRPLLPVGLPFQVPNSVRPIDPTMPTGALLYPANHPYGKDPATLPVAIYNNIVNYGWEYVYHCHLLAHEEMDMMHSVAVAVKPEAPTGLTATVPLGRPRIQLDWTDNSLNETAYTVQRAVSPGGPWTTIATLPALTGTGPMTYEDLTVRRRTSYYYSVFANNLIGDTGTPGFPTTEVFSPNSNTVNVITR